MHRSALLLIWMCMAFGFFTMIGGDRIEILGSVYHTRNEQVYNGKAPKNIFIKSINETIIFIGENSYKIMRFGPMRRFKMKITTNMIALIDKYDNTVSSQGGQIFFDNHKTMTSHTVLIAENHNTYRMALDIINSRVFVITRLDEEPYGKVFVFNTTNPVIDSQNRVVMNELTKFGDHVSAITIDPIVGNIIYSHVINKSKWTLKLLALDKTAGVKKLGGGLNNALSTTAVTLSIIKTTTSAPILIESRFGDTVETMDMPVSKKVISQISQPMKKADSDLEEVLKKYTNKFVSIYSRGSDERVKSLTIENRRLRFELQLLIDKHEYLLAIANVFFTPVAPLTVTSTENVDTYKQKFTTAVKKMENELIDLLDTMCTI